jgi:hypothetical protein
MMVRALYAERVSQSKPHCRLVGIHIQNVFSQKEVSVWCNKFKDDQTALNDDPEKHRGRTKILIKIVSQLRV